MPRRPKRDFTPDRVRAEALEIIGSMQDLIDRIEEAKLRVRDLQVEVSQLAHDAGASWPEIGAVTDESGDAVRVRAQRRRTGQG